LFKYQMYNKQTKQINEKRNKTEQKTAIGKTS